MKRILEYDFSKKEEHYIHYLTGPGCMTDGFENWLDKMNLPKFNQPNLRGIYRNYKFKKLLYIYDNNLFHKNYVIHKFSGQWKNGWTKNRYNNI